MLIYPIPIIMNQEQILSQLYDQSPIYFKHENNEIDLNLEIGETELDFSYVDDENFDIYISSSKIIKNYKKMVNASDINVNKKRIQPLTKIKLGANKPTNILFIIK